MTSGILANGTSGGGSSSNNHGGIRTTTASTTTASTSPSSLEVPQPHRRPRPRPHPRPRPLAHLILIRHPQTTANAAHLLQGCTDSPLTPRGSSQLTALAQYVRTWGKRDARQDVRDTVNGGAEGAEGGEGERKRNEDEDGDDGDDDDGDETDLAQRLSLPCLIAHSTLGRCTLLAEAIAAAVGEEQRKRNGGGGEEAGGAGVAPFAPLASSASASSPSPLHPHSPPQRLLHPSQDLKEKSFGSAECTRRGVHAGPSFPVADRSLKREGREEFTARVRRSGRMWIRKAVEVGLEATVKDGESPAEEQQQQHQHQHQQHQQQEAPNLVARSRPPPTILLITHGLYISTFLSTFQHCTTLSPLYAHDGRGRIPFADNTAMCVLRVHLDDGGGGGADGCMGGAGTFTESRLSWQRAPTPTPSPSPKLYLEVANYAPHLASTPSGSNNASSSSLGTKRQRGINDAAGGIGVVMDRKQRRLDAFFPSFDASSPSSSSSSSSSSSKARGRGKEEGQE